MHTLVEQYLQNQTPSIRDVLPLGLFKLIRPMFSTVHPRCLLKHIPLLLEAAARQILLEQLQQSQLSLMRWVGDGGAAAAASPRLPAALAAAAALTQPTHLPVERELRGRAQMVDPAIFTIPGAKVRSIYSQAAAVVAKAPAAGQPMLPVTYPALAGRG